MHFLFLAIFSQITVLHVFTAEYPFRGSLLNVFYVAFNCCLNGVKAFPYRLFSILEKLLKKRSQTSAQPAATQGVLQALSQPSSACLNSSRSPQVQQNADFDLSYLHWEIKVRRDCCSTWLPMMQHIFISLEDSMRHYLTDFIFPSVDSTGLILYWAIALQDSLCSCRTLYAHTTRAKLTQTPDLCCQSASPSSWQLSHASSRCLKNWEMFSRQIRLQRSRNGSQRQV